MALPPYILDKLNLGTLNLDELNAMIKELYGLIGGGVTALGAYVSDAAPGSGPINNYSPPGFGTATGILDITPPAGGTIINGIAPGNPGQIVLVRCRSATDSVQLNNEAAGPSAAWRIQTLSPSLIVIPLDAVLAVYIGGSTNRWSAA